MLNVAYDMPTQNIPSYCVTNEILYLRIKWKTMVIVYTPNLLEIRTLRTFENRNKNTFISYSS